MGGCHEPFTKKRFGMQILFRNVHGGGPAPKARFRTV
jgi:hypothetical protein